MFRPEHLSSLNIQSCLQGGKVPKPPILVFVLKIHYRTMKIISKEYLCIGKVKQEKRQLVAHGLSIQKRFGHMDHKKCQIAPDILVR